MFTYPIWGTPAVPAAGATEFIFVQARDDDTFLMPTPQYLYDGTTPAVYDYVIDWGDGSGTDHITAWNQAEASHEYTGLTGNFTITITGRMDAFRLSILSALSQEEIVDFLQWGDVQIKEFIKMWYGASNMSYSCQDAPILATGAPNAHSLLDMFYDCGNILGDSASGVFSNWDVSTITVFEQMFYHSGWAIAGSGAWDVSAGESFYAMFEGTTAFDEDLSAWTPTAADPNSIVEPIFNSFENFLYDATGFSVASYDLLLTAWSALTFAHADQYLTVDQNYTAAAAMAVLEGAPNNWTIIDYGPL